jgi:hypothetical protein
MRQHQAELSRLQTELDAAKASAFATAANGLLRKPQGSSASAVSSVALGSTTAKATSLRLLKASRFATQELLGASATGQELIAALHGLSSSQPAEEDSRSSVLLENLLRLSADLMGHVSAAGNALASHATDSKARSPILPLSARGMGSSPIEAWPRFPRDSSSVSLSSTATSHSLLRARAELPPDNPPRFATGSSHLLPPTSSTPEPFTSALSSPLHSSPSIADIAASLNLSGHTDPRDPAPISSSLSSDAQCGPQLHDDAAFDAMAPSPHSPAPARSPPVQRPGAHVVETTTMDWSRDTASATLQRSASNDGLFGDLPPPPF